MFERTALPDGPRVISARIPGSRSVSIAAYVLAGSRLEAAGPGGRRPLHGAHHVQGHGGLPDDPRDLRGDRGRRRQLQRGDRPRVDRLLGPRPGPPGGPGGRRRRRAHRPAPARGRTRSTTSARSSSRRSGPTSTTRRSTPRSCIQQAMFGDGAARPRDLRRRGRHPDPAARRRSASSGRRPTGRRTSSWRSPATSTTPAALDLVARAVRDRATGSARRSRRRPPCRPGRAYLLGNRDTTQAHICLAVPAYRRDHPGLVDARRPQRGPRRGDEQPAVPGGPRGARAGLRRRLGDHRVRRQRRARRVRRGRPGQARAGARRRSWPSSRGCATSPSPTDELAKAKAYLSGGLELRMDDTRHLASWIGGQEALHDRVLTLDEALEAVAAVSAADVHRVAGELFRDDRAPARRRRAARPRARPRPARSGCRADRHGDGIDRSSRRTPRASRRRRRAEPASGPGRDRRPSPEPADRPAELRVARLHLRTGSLRPGPGRARDTGRARARSTTRRCSTWPRSAGGPTT